MKKLLLSSLFITSSIFACNNQVFAETSDGYQMLPVHVEWTKQSKDFQKKNLMLIPLPDNVTEGSEFYGVKGKFTTITEQNLDSQGKDITDSETLFNLSSSITNACPTNGEEGASYPDVQSKYGTQSYVTAIVKQVKAGTKSVDMNFTLSKGLPLKFGAKKCMYLILDGSDFANKPYTMKADLEIKYKVPNPKPIKKYSLDFEFTAGGLSYVVYPVNTTGKAGAVVPGTLMSVFGDASSSNTKFPNVKNWSVRNRIVVYKNGSCQKAFPNHALSKFQWQDSLNHSFDLPATQVVSDMLLQGSGIDTDMKEMNGNSNLPIHLEDGDCVAHVISNDKETFLQGVYYNQETQTHFTVIPD